MAGAPRIEAAEVVLPCAELDATLAFFTDRLGFRVVAISPADDPAVAVVAGHGLRVRLERGGAGAPGVVRLLCRDPGTIGGGAAELLAPNGTRVVLVGADPPLDIPPLRPSFVFAPMADEHWRVGRAGMHYRDLIPDRQGGRFIASHIRITAGGPVPDYVHYHRVRFQMIYCCKGWARVVYEDQGPPFLLGAGDCVLQPPRIRHRVLESSPGLEVVELTCPASHDTLADLDLELPTGGARPDRDFEGQRFVHHRAAAASWSLWRISGFEARDLGIAAATGGLADARVVRRRGEPDTTPYSHSSELLFRFLLAGEATLLRSALDARRMRPGDAVVVPAREPHALSECSADLELLEVAVR